MTMKPPLLLALGLLFSCATVATRPTAAESATSATPRLSQDMTGIDVSTHSGWVDWARVAAAGHRFAFAKATEGKDLADASFAKNWPAMKAAGLIRGAYHFYVTEDDPEAMANFFISTVTLEPGDLAPVVDIELIGQNTEPGLVDRLHTFLDLLEAHYGVKPMIYTSARFWNANLDDTFGDHALWVAEYDVDTPTVPEGWSAWHLWQWKGDATVDGVEISADLNRVSAAGAARSDLFVPLNLDR